MRFDPALLLPALFPSWRFFAVVEAGLRVEWREAATGNWTVYRPRLARVTLLQSMRRLFWNPWWNEALHMVSLSERLLEGDAAFALPAMQDKIRFEARGSGPHQFRVLIVSREGDTITSEVGYESAPFS